MSTASQEREGAGTRRRDFITCAVLLVLTGALALATVALPPSSLRMWLVVIVLSSAPGWGLVGFDAPRSTALAWTMAVSASLACSMLVSLTLLVTHFWHPDLGFKLLLTLAALLLALHTVRLGVNRR